MTIGIGVLCSSKPRPHAIRPDGIILLADTMGSTDTDSTAELHKICVEEKENLFLACAGDLSLCNDVGSLIKQNMGALTDRTHGRVWEAINGAVHEALMSRFGWDVLRPKYMFTPGTIFDNQRENLIREWQEYCPQLEMLVGTFHNSGQALLYWINRFQDSHAWVHHCPFPGFATIGSGSYNASFWLKFRDQQLGLNPKQSAYHAIEAKIMAANAPTVNNKIDVVAAFADRHYVLSDETPEKPDCPFSLSDLKTMYAKYGPQSTFDLGHPPTKPLTARKSKLVR